MGTHFRYIGGGFGLADHQTFGDADVQDPQSDGNHNPEPVKVTVMGWWWRKTRKTGKRATRARRRPLWPPGRKVRTPIRSLAAGPGDGRLRRENENEGLNKGKRETNHMPIATPNSMSAHERSQLGLVDYLAGPGDVWESRLKTGGKQHAGAHALTTRRENRRQLIFFFLSFEGVRAPWHGALPATAFPIGTHTLSTFYAQHVFRHVLCHVLRHVLVVHMSPKGKRGRLRVPRRTPLRSRPPRRMGFAARKLRVPRLHARVGRVA